jgi:type II secretory pathway pseudopilin PulG
MTTRIEDRGYTIVEVMLFMAISGFMFVIAAGFVQGKQTGSELRQGINDVNSMTRQVVNDVGNGFFPSASDFRCTAGSAGGQPLFDKVAAVEQGTNKDCVFMGKVIQFRAETGNSDYYIYTIAGRHYKGSPADGTIPVNFVEASPKAVYNPSAGPPPGLDLTDKRILQGGLEATGMYSCNADLHADCRTTPAAGSYTPIAAVGFFTSFGSYLSSGNLASGSQNVIVVPIPGNGASGNESEADMVDNYIKNGVTDTAVEDNPRIVVCFKGGNNKTGTLTIGGGNGQRLTTAVKINEPCPV